MTRKEKYKIAKINMFVLGKKGAGRCVAFGPYACTYFFQDENVSESWDDIAIQEELFPLIETE